jgi:hypothetical protein
VRSFKDLKVWQKGHELTLAIYRATKSFPKDEMYGMTSQLRRAAASILRILQRVAYGEVAQSSVTFSRWLWVQQVNLNITFCFRTNSVISTNPYMRP